MMTVVAFKIRTILALPWRDWRRPRYSYVMGGYRPQFEATAFKMRLNGSCFTSLPLAEPFLPVAVDGLQTAFHLSRSRAIPLPLLKIFIASSQVCQVITFSLFAFIARQLRLTLMSCACNLPKP